MRPEPAAIVFVSDAAGFGGAEILAADLAAALAARGQAVTFLAASGTPGADRLRARLGPVPLVCAPVVRGAGVAAHALVLQRAARTAAALRRLSPSIVVVNQPDPEHGHAAALAARALRPLPRVVGLLHLPQELATLGARRFAVARSAAARLAFHTLYHRVVAISAASADEAARWWAPRARVAACPNGIPLPASEAPGERAAARSALGLPADGQVVAFLGRLTREQKGLDLLVSAARATLAAQPSTRFVVAGEGPSRGWLRSELRSAGIERGVMLHPWLAPRQLLLASDVVVLPSRFEGLPLVLLEAGALRRDVVATAVGGMPEVLEPSAVAPPDDAAAFTAVLQAALADPAASRARAARLEARVRTHHSIDAMASRFLALLEALR